MMANVTQRTAQRLRESISVKINKLPLKYFDKVSYGDVLSRITNASTPSARRSASPSARSSPRRRCSLARSS